jgi:hypothetical protein
MYRMDPVLPVIAYASVSCVRRTTTVHRPRSNSFNALVAEKAMLSGYTQNTQHGSVVQ